MGKVISMATHLELKEIRANEELARQLASDIQIAKDFPRFESHSISDEMIHDYLIELKALKADGAIHSLSFDFNNK